MPGAVTTQIMRQEGGGFGSSQALVRACALSGRWMPVTRAPAAQMLAPAAQVKVVVRV